MGYCKNYCTVISGGEKRGHVWDIVRNPANTETDNPKDLVLSFFLWIAPSGERGPVWDIVRLTSVYIEFYNGQDKAQYPLEVRKRLVRRGAVWV